MFTNPPKLVALKDAFYSLVEAETGTTVDDMSNVRSFSFNTGLQREKKLLARYFDYCFTLLILGKGPIRWHLDLQ